MFEWVNPGRWGDGWMGGSVGEWVVGECLDGWLCGWMHAYGLDKRCFGALEEVPIPMFTRNQLNDFQGFHSALGFCFPMNLAMFLQTHLLSLTCLPGEPSIIFGGAARFPQLPCPLVHLLLPLCHHFICRPHYLVLKPSLSCFSSWEQKTSQPEASLCSHFWHPAQSWLWELNWFPGSACFDVF